MKVTLFYNGVDCEGEEVVAVVADAGKAYTMYRRMCELLRYPFEGTGNVCPVNQYDWPREERNQIFKQFETEFGFRPHDYLTTREFEVIS